MYRQLRLCVVIPAFNEEDAILAAIESVPDFVDEIVVVDDASADETCERALTSSRVPVLLRHPVNRGVGAAIVSGYRHALRGESDVAIVMAGDGQMDPADLPALLDPIAEGRADYCKGNRFAHREILIQMPTIRVMGNAALSVATKVTSGYRHVFDSQCGYTAITSAALEQLQLDKVFPRYGYPNDMLAHLFRSNARVVDVPVRPIYGPSWKSGVRWHTAVYPVGFVLLKSWWNRMRSE
ncbi:MAG: glycosyltransferase family 2 protein [Myxococcales bacterium]|nr:glycosyltransferase family 2 protein [Myxococcales bacterium]